MSKIRPITGRTALVGVMGWPVKHSLSPSMHNAAFAELGLDWAYVPLTVQPDEVERALKGLAALNFAGVNVTLPHKQAVMRYMDELEDTALKTGSVNTIHLHDGKYWGYNTDVIGFLNSLAEANCYPKGMRAAVLGAGGSARSVVFALASAEAESVVVLNRTAERAAFLVEDLADSFPKKNALTFGPLTGDTLVGLEGQVDLVINTTSVGMYPHEDTCPWPADVPMPKAIYYDLVYNPLETMFLACARLAGGKTVDGLGMLVHQGAVAFEKWTGRQAPTEVMRQACLEQLGVK